MAKGAKQGAEIKWNRRSKGELSGLVMLSDMISGNDGVRTATLALIPRSHITTVPLLRSETLISVMCANSPGHLHQAFRDRPSVLLKGVDGGGCNLLNESLDLTFRRVGGGWGNF